MQLDDRVLLVDKRPGSTSFAAVRSVRRLARLDKVGHCGSLDPLATGLLILVTGVGTRIASLFVDQPKVYLARVRFGRATDSYDADGRTTREAPVPPLDEARLRAALHTFEGEIEQRPPLVSALKVQGKRLYELAREGSDLTPEPRRVMVYEIALVEAGAEHADIRVRCGRGCYVRSIAHDLGAQLDIPAHLESLRRVAIGPYGVERAVTLEQIEAAWQSGGAARLAGALLPLPEALGFVPALQLRAGFETGLRHGVQPTPQALREMPRRPGPHRLVSDDGRRLLAIVEVEGRSGAGAMRLGVVFPLPLEIAAEESG